MIEQKTFEPAEQVLRSAQQLMDTVVEQNRNWPGSGVFEKDVNTANVLLREMGNTLSEIILAVADGSIEIVDADRNTAIYESINKAYHLMSRLHDDVRTVREALGKGKSQSDAIEQAAIHLHRLSTCCEKTRDYLLNVSRQAAENR